MKSLWKSFASLKLVIVLLIIIAIASIIGTLIPQQRSLQEYAVRYGRLAGLFTRLQLTHVYHSFWYLVLLFLFALNITICTLSRLSPKLRKALSPTLETDAKKILSLRITGRFKKNAGLPATQTVARQMLISHHYRLREAENDGKLALLARKKILGWFGSDLVHAGLLVIIAGGIVSGMGGSREHLTLMEGQIIPVPRTGFELRLDKFETEYYPTGSVKDWKSTLTVLEKNRALLTKKVEVNHPLSHKGFSFYQVSYGWNWDNPVLEIWAKKRDDPSFLRKTNLIIGERIPLEDQESTQISVMRFIPDFIIGEDNQAFSRSQEPNNPAAFIEGWQKGEKVFSGWIFANFPDFARMHSLKETGLSFELKNYKAGQFSVIEAARDPGVNLIWAGSIFLMIGLFLAFYWPTREIKIILEEIQGKTEVTAGGIAAKNKEGFQTEFEHIMNSLRRSK
ncbi:MAG: cytochrome c biogenesis protein ResB [Candidatus Aminicenantales bacterium]